MDTCPLCRHEELTLTGVFATMASLNMRSQAVSMLRQKCFRPEDSVVLTMPNGTVYGFNGATGDAIRFSQRAYMPAAHEGRDGDAEHESRSTQLDANAALEEQRASIEGIEEIVAAVLRMQPRTMRLVLHNPALAETLLFQSQLRADSEHDHGAPVRVIAVHASPGTDPHQREAQYHLIAD